MSATNGGRGKPPVPPEGHGPPQQIQVGKEIVQQCMATDAERTPNGGLSVSFVVTDGGEPIRRTFLVGEPGRKAIQEAVNGGVEVAHAGQMPKAG